MLTEKFPYVQSLGIESVAWGRLVTRHELGRSKLKAQEVEQLLETMTAIPAIEEMTCQRCHNQAQHLFGILPAQPEFGLIDQRVYCLKCIQMGRMTKGGFLYYLQPPEYLPLQPGIKILTWQGQLSLEQARASKDIVESLADPSRPHMVHAVTGAGKTEMIFPAIATVLERGGRVAVVSPRIDVCLELVPRLQAAFASIPIHLLYGGSETLYAYTPLVVSTTHQLLRFKSAFDLLIVDEVDAFPYVGDESLHYAVQRAVKNQRGKIVYLTATPDEKLNREVQEGSLTLTTLPARYHGHPLPEPTFKWIGDWRVSISKRHKRSKLWQLIQKFVQIEGIKLIFMPNIRLAEHLYDWMSTKNKSGKEWLACVHAKDPQRKEKINQLRSGELTTLITTTILERGVTFTNCHVCIIGAEDRLYSMAALVQMSGRVGRKSDYPTGHLVYAHGGVSRSMRQARRQIAEMNQVARQRGLLS